MMNQANVAGIVETVIETRARELVDGFKVRRALPSRQRRMVGPFIFLDQMGPEILSEGRGLPERLLNINTLRPRVSSGAVALL